MNRSTPSDADSRRGVVYGLAAYGLWGLMPLYFTALHDVSPYEVLAQRVVWCGLLLAGLVTALGQWDELRRIFTAPRICRMFVLSAILLSINWLVYIYGVQSKQTVETSLGYFINPLFNVALGVVVFRERLRPLQKVAIALGVIAVLTMIYAAGHFPWIALSVATSFAFYGLIRKVAPAETFVGLAVETFVLLPFAVVGMFVLNYFGELNGFHHEAATSALLVASGAITAVPLLFFGKAARLVSLSTLGFIQYLAPTMQFVLAVTVLHETLDPIRLVSFAFIWFGLAIYSFDAFWANRRTVPEITRTS